MTKRPVVRLLPSRHKRVAGGHPWVFSNEVVMDAAAKSIEPGTIVSFLAHDGSLLGHGSFNHHSLISGRLFSRSPLDEIDVAWFETRLSRALVRRNMLIDEPYYRLVHAEADGLPGLIIDRFGDCLSVQLNTAGMQRLWPEIQGALESTLRPKVVVLHNDSSVRQMEGLSREVLIAKGELKGPIEVKENGITYFADLIQGQKTGWYYDQRDNHALIAKTAKDKTVLDLYTHAGGFALLAAHYGVRHVTGVDSSSAALDLASQGAMRNKLDGLCDWVRADVFDDLEARQTEKQTFDIVIADPPPFVKSRKDIAAGARGYRKLATMASRVTKRGGMLFIASCSHNMELPLFIAEVARGIHEAKRQGQILYTTFAAPDHPVHPHLPESAYLKGLVILMD